MQRHYFFCFFFQAEDGIRDKLVTGVQTCALPICWTAVTWVVIITILFLLPQAGPITWKTFNYAIFAVAVVVGFAGIYWLVSARKWFTGPRVQGSAEELAAIEHELTEIYGESPVHNPTPAGRRGML